MKSTQQEGTIDVWVAADAPPVRERLESQVRSRKDLEVRGGSDDIGSFLDAMRRLHPEVAVVSFDNAAPAELLALGGSASAPAVLVLTGEPEHMVASDWLRAGARGVLPRDLSTAELGSAIHAAAAGLTVLHPSATLRTSGAPPSPLTPRESEVLRLIAAGHANKEIAWRLSISEHTVKFHVASILDKLHASSRTEAVTIGLRSGYLTL